MGLNLDYIDGETPLDEDEKEGLLIDSITTREELDEFEQINIQEAIEWTISKRFKRAADQIFKRAYFTWGRFELSTKEEARGNYLIGLKKADLGNIEALLEFSRS